MEESHGRRNCLLRKAKTILLQPLVLTNTQDNFDIRVKVIGGGISGQAGAIRHGITRALLMADPELRQSLKRAGFVRRDSRVKERKKYGQKGARARYQFSKR
ncbi:MAG: 30S ribosomal protein S9 [Deltaproteobacteria bacterium]|nr:30S ribosomal protein S9 [Deltaproteobacteria bacterium]